MNKLIVGCGYLGLRIASLWREQGHHVFATTRKPARAEELARLGIEPVVCDVLDPPSLGRLPRVDGIVYCVGMDRTAGASMRQVYVDGLRNALQHLQGSPRLVYVSSTSVYGQTAGEEVDENAVTQPTDESGRVILAAEQILRQLRDDAVLLRFAGIYGSGRLFRAEALRLGTPLSVAPEGWLNLIHVEDGARAVVAALANGQPGAVYNVSDGCPVRRGEFYGYLAELLQAPAPQFLPPSSVQGRRIVNARMLAQLAVDLRYPSFKEGLRASS